MQKTLVRAARVVTPHLEFAPGEVLVDGPKVAAIGAPGFSGLSDVPVIDLGRAALVPGFIDIHHHGALGVWVGDNPEAVNTVAGYLPSTGTTGWLPSVGSPEAVRHIMTALARMQVSRTAGMSRILGIHMEGPFLAPKNLPGEAAEGLTEVDMGVLNAIFEAGQGLIRIVGVSPELPGAVELIREIRRNGAHAAVAHTKADYDLFMVAVKAGLDHVTHTFNVMTGLHHRRPGAVGGILTQDILTCELIADGYHVHPAAMKVLVRCKGPAKICMITDNVSMAGLPDGVYGPAVKKDGMIRKAGFAEDVDGTLYGSAWPANHNLGVLVNQVGLTLSDALTMAALTPATVIGVADVRGSIEPGKFADLTALDANFGVLWTMVEGEVVYQRGA